MKETLSMQVHRLLGLCWHECDVVSGRCSSHCRECGKELLYKNPSYTTDLNAAFKCVEFLLEKGIELAFLCNNNYTDGRYSASFDLENGEWVYVHDSHPARAICKAFVKVQGEEPVADAE